MHVTDARCKFFVTIHGNQRRVRPTRGLFRGLLFLCRFGSITSAIPNEPLGLSQLEESSDCPTDSSGVDLVHQCREPSTHSHCVTPFTSPAHRPQQQQLHRANATGLYIDNKMTQWHSSHSLMDQLQAMNSPLSGNKNARCTGRLTHGCTQLLMAPSTLLQLDRLCNVFCTHQ